MGSNERRRRANIRQGIALLVIVVGAVTGFYLYAESIAHEGIVTAYFERIDGSKTRTFLLEVAANDSERAKGLMYRKELATDRGMIFIYPNDGAHSFWMKNTYVSLDIVFLNVAREVVGVIEHVPILTTATRDIGKPSRSVIELAAGTVASERIVVGAKAVFKPDIATIEVR